MGIKERKEREKEARREEIITAAEQIFFEKGLAAATMDDVAEKAELSKGTLYLYYKSKEDLFMAVAMRGMDILQDLFEKATTTGEPTLKLIMNLGDAYYEYFEKHRDYFRTLYYFETPAFRAQVSPETLAACTQGDKKVWDLVFGVIRQAIDEGLLHSGLDPVEVGVMLWSNSNGLMRIMDRLGAEWCDHMGIDLMGTLKKSNALLVEAMMSDEAKKRYPEFVLDLDARQANHMQSTK